ncbi:hypothetical protein XHC_3347 [Xanthomonas hortorum pv. carotae str. M081]|nr:hypothetical protein XHC_3347 [Xanthomonas hortorum pv. carotae str. M081]
MACAGSCRCIAGGQTGGGQVMRGTRDANVSWIGNGCRTSGNVHIRAVVAMLRHIIKVPQ